MHTSCPPLGYWLVAPLPQWRQKKVKALVDALAS
jgi:LysR family glycine cleavage system transcriptional activator